MIEQQSPRDAIRLLYERHSDDVYRYAKLTLNDSSEAYDVVQEVFLRAFRSWNQYRHDANAKTWLIRIARNYIFDSFRRKRIERDYLLNYNEPQTRDEAVFSQLKLEIEEALSLLNINYQQVIILRYIQGLSILETSQILGWSESKVRVTAHRAMTKLKEIYGSDSEEVKIKDGFRSKNP
ncbi:RNA polymerase sigma factor [Alicyclobacillus tolerans]|uniref:RNA polymerase sigma factor n=1 Tax=Alicyclobacillus tolerans TaxID=90970 RepID=UPI003B7DA875